MKYIHLYVKQCAHCGLKYFGKTTRNPYEYLGSGKYWMRHYKLHGTLNIKTIEVISFTEQEKATKFALSFSKKNNIIESSDWANLKFENALDGGQNEPISEAHLAALKKGRRNSKNSIKHKAALLNGKLNYKYTDEVKQKMREKKLLNANRFLAASKAGLISSQKYKVDLNRQKEHSERMKLWWAERKANNLKASL